MMKRFSSLLAAVCYLSGAATPAHADSIYLTAPTHASTRKVSMATSPREYRLDVARHIYASYPHRIFHGRLPPLIHAVVVLEMTVNDRGEAKDVKVIRGPSHAPDVTAAVREMTYRVSPLPIPARLGAQVKYLEIWLVHKDGRFQLDALTEGQD
ncbi:MAG: hypothetical protein ABI809_03745 [Caldimonas sp.]